MIIPGFQNEVRRRVAANRWNEPLRKSAADFLKLSHGENYSYNFTYMDRPIIQYPQDMAAVQELIWEIKPDLVIETGVAHGGSIVFSASQLALLDLIESRERGQPVLPTRCVLGIDIEIRPHNRRALESHPMRPWFELFEVSSTNPETIREIQHRASEYERVIVMLDSNHTEEHVLGELEAYAGLVSVGSYCIVFDTLIEDLPDSAFPDRPWSQGNNPRTAVEKFLRDHPEFEPCHYIDDKLLISTSAGGYLKRKC